MKITYKKHLAEGARIRVLVVDDSIVIRQRVREALRDDGCIEVVGTASSGKSALRLMPLLKPDVMALDIEMPEMGGIETLRRAREIQPDLIGVMLTPISEEGALLSMEALAQGANDYVTKESGEYLDEYKTNESIARLRRDLLPKLKQFFVLERAKNDLHYSGHAHRASTGVGCQAVGIGVSTGGPSALSEILPQFPADFEPPIFIVQHMPPIFTRLLAERLENLCRVRVREAADGMVVESGTAYIAPGDYHMRVKQEGTKKLIALDQAGPENSCRPAVDVTFRSLADVYGSHCLAVVLTGMGHDGLRGVERLREAGAYVIAQDESSSVVWGMPGAVIHAGLADCITDLKGIAREIQRHL